MPYPKCGLYGVTAYTAAEAACSRTMAHLLGKTLHAFAKRSKQSDSYSMACFKPAKSRTRHPCMSGRPQSLRMDDRSEDGLFGALKRRNPATILQLQLP